MTKPAAAAATEPPKQAPAEEDEKKKPTSSSAAALAPPSSSPSPNKPHASPLPALAAAAPWLPFRVAHSKALGRHALAVRDIAAGELLLVERPVAAVPRGEHRLRACPACAGGVCGGQGRPCSPACAARASALGKRTAPALSAIEEASQRHGMPHSCFEGLGREDLRDLWTLVASLVAAAAIEASEGSKEEEGGAAEEEQKEDSCGHDHGPNPEADPELDNAESAALASAAAASSAASSSSASTSTSSTSTSSSSPVPETHWPLRCSALEDLPFLLDGWDRFKPSWRAQAVSMAKEVHAALVRADRDRNEKKSDEGGKSDDGKSSSNDNNKPSSSSFFLPSNGTFSNPLDLARLSCLVATNAHGSGAGNPASVDFGFGLFPALAAAFNHSCEPTANFCAAGGHMRARALRDIKSGEQLTVSYVNLFEPRRTRAHQLMEAKHFVCRCPRCSVPLLKARDRFLDGVACRERGCKGGTLIPLGRDDGVGGGGGGGGASSKNKKNKKKKKKAAAAAAAGNEQEGAKASNEKEEEAEEEQEVKEEEEKTEERQESPVGGIEPPWTCDTCGASVKARSLDGKGPADLCDAAASLWSRAAATSRSMALAAAGNENANNIRAAAAAAAAPLYESIVALSPKKLHPHHVLVFDSLMPLCNGLRAAKDPSGAARAVGALISAMDALVGVPSAELGNLLQLHAELLAERCSESSGKGGTAAALNARLARSARESAARALEVRRITLGARNPLTREAAELVESLKGLK